MLPSGVRESDRRRPRPANRAWDVENAEAWDDGFDLPATSSVGAARNDARRARPCDERPRSGYRRREPFPGTP
jgi:hypothetical protein